MNARKPHAGNAGYICERKARLGGHVVVYDRKAGFDCDAGERWIVMHEPSSLHVAVATERSARELMKACAEARTVDEAPAQIFPEQDQVDEEPAAAPASAEAQLEALERFMAAEDLEAERAAWRDLVEASPAPKRGGRS